MLVIAGKWTPYASNRFVRGLHRMLSSFQLISRSVSQQVHFAQDFGRLHVTHADDLFSAIDISSTQDRMPMRAFRDSE